MRLERRATFPTAGPVETATGAVVQADVDEYNLQTKIEMENIREKLAAGSSVASLAKEYDTSRQTIMRIRDAAGASSAMA